MRRRAFVAVLMLVTATAATAQSNRPGSDAPLAGAGPTLRSASACVDSGAAGSYAACALRSDDLVLRQGATGVVIARPGALRAPAVVPLVVGDSAAAYARHFERQFGRSRTLNIVTAAIVIGSLFTIPQACWRNDRAQCRGSDLAPFIALQVVGLGTSIPASYLRRRAVESLSTAVWWHNAQYAR